MRKIQFSPPDISSLEIDEVVAVLNSGWITTGNRTKLFEQKIADYCGTNKAVCLGSCTAGLELTLRLLGIEKGDEVITTPYTYTATASVINHIGAKIVFVDTANDSYEMDYEKLTDAITAKTKAVIPVDIGGVIVDYDRIFDAVESKKELFYPKTDIQKLFDRVIVLSDAAHSFGASQNSKKSGTISDFTAFSFHAVKNITTSEGGAVTWKSRKGLDDEYLYHQFNMLSLHGQTKDALSKTQDGTWEYDIISTGYKCNMTDIAAAMGLKQLERFEQMAKRRKEIAKIYDKYLLPLGIDRLEHNIPNNEGNAHLYMLRIPNIDEATRNEIIQKAAEKGIICNVHFKPLPLHTAYKDLGFTIEDYPNAYNQYRNEISLPLHTKLTDEDAEYVGRIMMGMLLEMMY